MKREYCTCFSALVLCIAVVVVSAGEEQQLAGVDTSLTQQEQREEHAPPVPKEKWADHKRAAFQAGFRAGYEEELAAAARPVDKQQKAPQLSPKQILRRKRKNAARKRAPAHAARRKAHTARKRDASRTQPNPKQKPTQPNPKRKLTQPSQKSTQKRLLALVLSKPKSTGKVKNIGSSKKPDITKKEILQLHNKYCKRQDTCCRVYLTRRNTVHTTIRRFCPNARGGSCRVTVCTKEGGMYSAHQHLKLQVVIKSPSHLVNLPALGGFALKASIRKATFCEDKDGECLAFKTCKPESLILHGIQRIRGHDMNYVDKSVYPKWMKLSRDGRLDKNCELSKTHGNDFHKQDCTLDLSLKAMNDTGVCILDPTPYEMVLRDLCALEFGTLYNKKTHGKQITQMSTTSDAASKATPLVSAANVSAGWVYAGCYMNRRPQSDWTSGVFGMMHRWVHHRGYQLLNFHIYGLANSRAHWQDLAKKSGSNDWRAERKKAEDISTDRGGDGKSYNAKKARRHFKACFAHCLAKKQPVVGFHSQDCDCAGGHKPIYGFLQQIPEDGCQVPAGTGHPHTLNKNRILKGTFGAKNGMYLTGGQDTVRIYAHGTWRNSRRFRPASQEIIHGLHGLCVLPDGHDDSRPPNGEHFHKNTNSGRRCVGGSDCKDPASISSRQQNIQRQCCQIRVDSNAAGRLCRRILSGTQIDDHCWLRVCKKKLMLTSLIMNQPLKTTTGSTITNWRVRQTLFKGTLCEAQADLTLKCQVFKRCIPESVLVDKKTFKLEFQFTESTGPKELALVDPNGQRKPQSLDQESAGYVFWKLGSQCSIENEMG